MNKSNEGLDQENRAYYMTIAIQRWLAVRLDMLGNILILGIGLFAAGFRGSVDPSKIGVVLSYTLSSTHSKTRSPLTLTEYAPQSRRSSVRYLCIRPVQFQPLLTRVGTTATVVSTYAENEQNFNAVERVLYYTELPREGDATTPNDPPTSWPESGEIKFKDVEMAYRPGLPNVLKGVTFEVKPGEKVCFLFVRGTS